MYVEVILPLAIEGCLTYSVPQSLEARVRCGVRVVVSLRRTKTYTGIISMVHSEKPDFETVDIIDILDTTPLVTDIQLSLWRWIADYYLSPIGLVYNAAMPAMLKKEEGFRPKTERFVALPENMTDIRSLQNVRDILSKSRAYKQSAVFERYLDLSGWAAAMENQSGCNPHEVTYEELRNESHCNSPVINSLLQRHLLRSYEKEVERISCTTTHSTDNIKPLSDVQQTALDNIRATFDSKRVVLLHGVTSSGKTEIYIHLIEEALSRGKQVLYLLPEIALTVQITSRLQRVFGDRMAIYHSKYSDEERSEIWNRQISDKPFDVILGVRSSVFLPFTRLGLIIVDEEHENSFKQQEPAPQYHARSVAIMLAKMCGARVLLGTATPSAETWHNAQTGKYGLIKLTTRYAGIQLPEIRVIDTADLQRRRLMNGPLSPPLLAAMRQALDEGRQVILFQNRRGFAPMIECKVCGWVPKCDNCDVSLTLHKADNLMTCHYCGHARPVPDVCPNCGNTDLHGRGFGTEKIEDYVRDIFPETRVARMDLDNTRTRNAYSRLISDFSSGRTNVLIGTQMISKGLDFDNVGVVGILSADSMLSIPDFRAYENAFTMMSQVSGRAGRKGRRGLVMLQTKNPKLPLIQQIVHNDTTAFYDELMEERMTFHYPPFYRLIYIYLRHSKNDTVERAALEMASHLRRALGQRVLGPDRPAIARVKSKCIRKIVIKLENGINLPRVREYLLSLHKTMSRSKRFASVDVAFDVDPQ